MKRMFVIMTALIVLVGISDVAFAKHHRHTFKKEEDNKEDKERKVACLVNGVRQMVKTETVCKDFNGTVVIDKTPEAATSVSKEKITPQKTENP